MCCIRIFFYQNATSVSYCRLLAASTHPLRILSDEKKLFSLRFWLCRYPFWSEIFYFFSFPIGEWLLDERPTRNAPIDVCAIGQLMSTRWLLLHQNDSINQVRAAAHLSNIRVRPFPPDNWPKLPFVISRNSNCLTFFELSLETMENPKTTLDALDTQWNHVFKKLPRCWVRHARKKLFWFDMAERWKKRWSLDRVNRRTKVPPRVGRHFCAFPLVTSHWLNCCWVGPASSSPTLLHTPAAAAADSRRVITPRPTVSTFTEFLFQPNKNKWKRRISFLAATRSNFLFSIWFYRSAKSKVIDNLTHSKRKRLCPAAAHYSQQQQQQHRE